MLIEEPGVRPQFSLKRECSASRAPVRALADYLTTVRFGSNTGTIDKFRFVRDGKADPEDLAKYPAACVYVEGEVKYGAEDGSLEPVYTEDLKDNHAKLFLAGEVQSTLLIHSWTNEDEHRETVLSALEDALSPVEWMSGFQLDMPHYYGCRASYQLMSMTFEDQMDDLQRRYRKCSALVMCRSPYARVFSLKPILPRFSLEVQ